MAKSAAKAATRIRSGASKKREGDPRDKSHLKMTAPGEAVSGEDAETLPAGSLVQGRRKTLVDPEDNESYDGMEAARESLMLRPDNPNRPPDVEGETWKVAEGGGLGRGTASALLPSGALAQTEERTQTSSTTPTPAQESIEESRQAEIEAEVAEREAAEKAKADALKAGAAKDTK